MTEYGFIRDVRYVEFGTAVIGDYAIGATSLVVEDAADFNEEGGTLTINETTQYAYVGADLDNDIIELEVPLDVALEDGDPVSPYPLFVEKHAVVVQDDADEALTVRVPHSLYDRLPEGMREEGLGEAIAFELIDGEWIVTDVLRRDVIIDGTYIDPETLPLPDLSDLGPDGEAPSFSPTPDVSGGIGSLFVKWFGVPNHDPVEYDVHVSTSEGFTPDASTLVLTTTGNTANIRTLADGGPVEYGETYYIIIVAKDVDGSASPSNESAGTPVQVTNEDIAVNYVYAGEISVNRLTGGTLTSDINLAASIKTAEQGARVEMNAGGIIVYRPDNTPTTVLESTGQSTFKGQVEAEGMTVKGGASFRSSENELTQGARLNLSAATTQSQQSPTVVMDWEQTFLKDANGDAWPTPGALSGLTNTVDGYWLAADTTQAKIHRWDSNGDLVGSTDIESSVTSVAQPSFGGAIYGLRVTGSTCYLMRLTEESLFSDSFADMTNWTTAGSVAASGGSARLTTSPGQTASMSMSANMRTNAVGGKVTLPSSRSTSQKYVLRVSASAQAFAELFVSGDAVRTSINGSEQTYSSNYNAVSHAYWRISEDNGLWRFSISADGNDWTLIRTGAHGLTVSQLTNMTWAFTNEHESDTPNLITNSTFETNTDGWLRGDGTPALRYTTDPYEGNYSLNIYASGNNVAAQTSVIGEQGIPVTVGKTYVLRFAYRGNGNSTGMRVSFTGSGTWFGAQTREIEDSDGEWIIQTGEFQATEPYATVQFWGSGHVAADDVSFREVPDGASVEMQVTDAEQVRSKVSVPYTRVNTAQVPVLNSYSGSLLVGEVTSGGYLTVKTVSLSTMAQTASWTAAGSGVSGPLAGIARGNFDYGVNTIIANTKSGPLQHLWLPYTHTDGLLRVQDAFDAISGGSVGMDWDGSDFYSLGTNGALHKHESAMTWTTESSSWSAGFTWADANYETPMSKPHYFTMKKRARLSVTSPDLPETPNGPDRIKIYVARPHGDASTHHYQVTTTAGVTSATLTSINWTGAAPPTVSTFLSGLPAEIRSTDGSLVITADGDIVARSISIIPAGSVQMFAGVAEPDGWLLCDGSAYSTVDYPELFAALGYAYGGSGSTFNVPDFTGAMPRGATPGDSGGSETKTLDVDNMPQHRHGSGTLSTSTDGNHSHELRMTPSTGTGGMVPRGQSGGAVDVETSNGVNANGAHSHNVTGYTDYSGNGTAFDVMNPWLGVNFIIKA